MRLYHRTNFNLPRSLILLILSIYLGACAAPQVTQGLITVNLTADKKNYQVKISSGSTVQEALNAGKISLEAADKVEPPLYTVLSDGDQVKVVRVTEEYSVKQEVIPFEHQELRNEALPDGETRLSQPGVNGLQEITYHRIYEDGVEVSSGIVKSVVLKAAIPEIVMVGSQSSFAPVAIPGIIAYLSGGNAWIIEDKTSERRLIVSTGDLDGRIFSLSQDGKFLLFTRFANLNQTINTLWMATLQSDPVKIIDLGIENVVLFAQFSPDSKHIAYSTAEWRETSPGWQANNDLWEAGVSTSGIVGTPRQIMPDNSGGVYGWWGTEFSYSIDGMQFLYARPDSIGLVDSTEGKQTPILKITPYQTGGNWAWVPGASLSYDQDVIYSLDNTSSETVGQQFDLVAISVLGGTTVHLVHNVGMFAYPVLSPPHAQNGVPGAPPDQQADQANFSVAYLQAIFPDQSETSQYRLSLMDRDGSNQISLYPAEGMPGLAPQHVVWSPAPMDEGNDYSIGFIYEGNIWLIDTVSGAVQQITGDGLTSRLDWR